MVKMGKNGGFWGAGRGTWGLIFGRYLVERYITASG